MSRPVCRFESQVAAGARAGRLEESVKRHAAYCSDCGDTLLVATWMTRAAASQAPVLPHPALLLLKAERQRRSWRQRRATLPIRWTARLTPLLMTAALAAAVWWKADALAAMGAALGPLPPEAVMGLLVAMAAALWGLLQISLYRFVED